MKQLLKQNKTAFRNFRLLPAYYAIVVLDGDEMGKWLSVHQDKVHGEIRESDEHVQEFLSQFSSAVDLFAGRLDSRARSLLGSTDGQPGPLSPRRVYVGGDDALFLCPLDALFPLIRAVRDEWHKAMQTLSQFGLGGQHPTLTLHVSVIHETSPLQPAIRQVHARLESAKNHKDGRNCLSLSVEPRSGSPGFLRARWDELHDLVRAIEQVCNWRFERLSPDLSASNVSVRVLHTILESLSGFFEEPVDGNETQYAAPVHFRNELIRNFRRSGTAKEDETWRPLCDWLARRGERGGLGSRSLFHGRRAVVEVLTVVAFLARILNWGVDSSDFGADS